MCPGPSANPVPYPRRSISPPTSPAEALGFRPAASTSRTAATRSAPVRLQPSMVPADSTLSVRLIPSPARLFTAVATGDFNKDGKQDLAVLESGSGSASLLISLGNGDGTFQRRRSIVPRAMVRSDHSRHRSRRFQRRRLHRSGVIASDGEIAVILAAGDAAGELALTQAQLIPTSIAPLAVATWRLQ